MVMTPDRPVAGQIWLNGERPPVYADLCELLGDVVHRNSLTADDVIELVFTSPRDAAAAVRCRGPLSYDLGDDRFSYRAKRVVEVFAHVIHSLGARHPRRAERTPGKW